MSRTCRVIHQSVHDWTNVSTMLCGLRIDVTYGQNRERFISAMYRYSPDVTPRPNCKNCERVEAHPKP